MVDNNDALQCERTSTAHRFCTIADINKLPTTLVQVDGEKYKNNEPIIAIGLHIQQYTSQNSRPAVDLFGYTEYGEAFLLQIIGDIPFFYCKVPANTDPKEFMNSVEADGVSLSIEYHIDDRYFTFGEKEPFIKCAGSQLFQLIRLKRQIAKEYRKRLRLPIAEEVMKAMLRLQEIVKTFSDANANTARKLLEQWSQIVQRDKDARKYVDEVNQLIDTINHNKVDSIGWNAELDDLANLQRLYSQNPIRFGEFVTYDGYAYGLMARYDVSLIGHIVIENYEICDATNVTTCNRMLRAHIQDIRQYEGPLNLLGNLVEISYDLETDNLDNARRKISNPKVDPLICIGLTAFRAFDREPILKACITYDYDTDPIDGVIIKCADEAEMIEAFGLVVRHVGIDVMLSFNGEAFDNAYLWTRAQIHDVAGKLMLALTKYRKTFISDDFTHRKKLLVSESAESMKGDSMYRSGLSRIKTNQWISFDARLHFVTKFPKEFGRKGSLQYMLQYFQIKDQNGEQMGKRDLPISRMYAYWRAKDRAGLAMIYDYCVQDCACPHFLIKAQRTYVDAFGLATASYTTIEDSLHRADGKRITKTTSRFAYTMQRMSTDEPIPPLWRTNDKGIVKGGEVKSLSPGHHKFVTSLDYSGQYPAQKMACNIDSAAKVPPQIIERPCDFGLECVAEEDLHDQYGPRKRFVFRRGDQLWTVEQFYYVIANVASPVYYVQSAENSIRAQMLRTLKRRRDEFRKQLRAATDRFEKDRLDAMQLATKILMNSEYGIGNNKVFGAYDRESAGAVTWCSRKLIEFLRRCLQIDMIIVPSHIFENVRTIMDELSFAYRECDVEDICDKFGIIMSADTMRKKWPNNQKWYRLIIPASQFIYQDTDSNYYTNRSLFEDDPRETMRKLNAHNELMNQIITGLIDRWPIKLGFEGAFITAYYMPQLKRYIGLKCPKEISADIPLHVSLSGYVPGESINEFLRKRNVKVTGIEIVRRETPHYIVLELFELFEKILSFTPPESLTTLVNEQIERFVKKMQSHSDAIPQLVSKQGKHNPSKNNDVKAIVDRLTKEGKEIPAPFESVRYVVVKDAITERRDLHGHGRTPVRERLKLLSENPTAEEIDVAYYTQRLCNVLANFLFEEYDYERYLSILSEEDPKNKIAALRSEIGNKLCSRYFTTAGHVKEAKQKYKEIQNKHVRLLKLDSYQTIMRRLFDTLAKINPNVKEQYVRIIEHEKELIKNDAKRTLSQATVSDQPLDKLEREFAYATHNYIAVSYKLLQKVKQYDDLICKRIFNERMRGSNEYIDEIILDDIKKLDKIERSELEELKWRREEFKNKGREFYTAFMLSH